MPVFEGFVACVLIFAGLMIRSLYQENRELHAREKAHLQERVEALERRIGGGT